MILDKFIKAGWYTVPMKGKLERLENGKKSLPNIEEGWQIKYAKERNEEPVKLAGVLTGKLSGIIALDCDNEMTYQMFKAFDPDYEFHFISKDKPAGGGTIIYKYNEEIEGFKFRKEGIELDFYSDRGMIYLPTENNYTKESWANKELPELRELPPAIKSIIKTFKNRPVEINEKLKAKHTISNRLAPMLQMFIKRKEYDPALFKILTPHSFRELPSYVSKGHLHPNDVPDGRGSEYLSKISAILGADISVDIELYTNTIGLINSFWDDPIEKSKLNATIITPMIESKACIDGVPIWQYDEHWEQMGFIATSINGDYLESFYDDIRGLYYLVNYTVPYVREWSDKRPLLTTLKTLLGRNITEGQYDASKQLIRTSLNPHLEFGHVEGRDNFNLFRQTEYLAVLNNPKPYAGQYSRPKHIIKYFESLIPDDNMRMFVLQFLKTKLTTFDYSPIVLYFIGIPGSGKDTFVNIIRYIIGSQYVAKPDTKVFLEQYNGWMLDKYFVQLDEYGNKLVRGSDRQEALGKIKAYTGSEDLQIRAMRTDGYNSRHSITFISTANKNPLPIETDDRRVAFIKTPNKLAEQKWVLEAGGIKHVQNIIKHEIMDFCYYLATEIDKLSGDEYVIAPETEDKEKLILDNLPALEHLEFLIQANKWDELKELAIEYAIDNFTFNWDKNKLDDDKLQELYLAMTDGNGSARALIKKMKSLGHSRQHTTKNGSNVFFYTISGLKDFVSSGEFTPVTNEAISLKGIS